MAVLSATRTTTARWQREARRTSGWGGLIYVLPALALLLVFEVWPIAFALWISLWKWDVGPLSYVGLGNYARLFGEGFVTIDYSGRPAVGEVLKSLIVTVYYVIGTVPVTIALAFFLAYLLFQPIRARGAVRTIYFLPYVTASVAITIVFGWIFNAQVGIANAVMQALGLPTQTWLEDPLPVLKRVSVWAGLGPLDGLPNDFAGPSVALLVIVIYSIWSTVGYNIVIYLAGLTDISPELYEAGRIDGASGWQLLRHVTWPLLMSSTFFLSIVNTISAFQAFSPIYTLTRSTGMGRGEAGGPLDTTLTITVYIFRNFYERANSVGYAAAVSILLFVIILGLTLLQFRVLGRRVHYQ
jgi:multiple sugar transport system permease protein